jgi:hypothetical protein
MMYMVFLTLIALASWGVRADSTSTASPEVLYVTTSTSGLDDGSAASPFQSLSKAFAAVSKDYTLIYLLAGTHSLITYSGTQLGDVAIQELTIRTLLCTEAYHAECASNSASVHLEDLDFQIKVTGYSLKLQDVEVEAKTSLVSGCSSEYCLYCPSTETVGGVTYSDKATVLTAYGSSCSTFHSHSFILVETGVLNAVNVTFSDFRAEFGHLIEAQDSDVSLTSVEFTNLRTQGPVMELTCTTQTCEFLYQTGSVQLLHNGYLNDGESSGFLAASGAKSVSLVEVVFAYNLGTTLIEVTDVLQTLLQHDKFQYNQLSQGSLKVRVMQELPADASDLTHLTLKNCEYSNNLSGWLVLDYFSSTDQLNCVLEDLLITLNSADNVKVINSNLYSLLNAEGGYREGTYVSQKSLQFNRVKLTSTYYASSAFYLLDSSNVSFTQVTVTLSGQPRDSSVDKNSLVQQYFIDFSPSYIDTQLNSSALTSNTGHVSVQSCTNVSFTELTFTDNFSSSLVAMLELSQAAGAITITDSQFSDNEGSASEGLVLSTSTSGKAEVSQVTMLRNINTNTLAGHILALTTTASAVLSNCEFSNNQASASIVMIAHAGCQATQITLSSNKVQGNGVFESIGTSQDETRLSYWTVTDNQGLVGAGVYLGALNSNQPHLIQADNFKFTANSLEDGRLFEVAEGMYLATGSYLKDSKFLSNTCGKGGVLGFFQLKGPFELSNTECSNNTGGRGGCISAAFSSNDDSANTLSVKDCSFTSNTAKAITDFRGNISNLLLQTSGLKFSHNQGLCFYLLQSAWKDSQSTYLANTSTVGVILMSYSSFTISSTFSDNFSETSGGAAYISQTSQGSFKECTFNRNSAALKGGAVFIDSMSSISLENSSFIQNSASSNGGAVSFSSSSQNSIKGCTFEYNLCKEGSVYFYDSSASITSSRFSFNIAQVAAAFLSVASNVTVSDTSITNHKADLAGSVFIVASAVTFERCIINNSTSQISGGFMLAMTGFVQFINCTISECKSGDGAFLFAHSLSSIVVLNSTISNISSSPKSVAIKIVEGDLAVNGATFLNFTTSAVHAASSAVTISSSSFRNLKGLTGSMISCDSCRAIELTSLKAEGCSSQQGGALYFSSEDQKALATVSLSNSWFFNNTADEVGGALWANNVNVIINDTQFTNNSAGVEAGALHLECSDSDQCIFNLTRTEFSHNSAAVRGGAVNWVDVQPALLNCSFSNNSAEYGPELASYPIALSLVRPEARLFQSEELPVIASGQNIEEVIKVSLVDHYSQVVLTASGYDCSIIGNINVTAKGQTRAISKDGVFAFQNFSIVAEPGYQTAFELYTSGIDEGRQSYSLSKTNITGGITVDVMMRQCVPGESLIAKECFICKGGTYNLKANSECLDCPVEALCPGSSILYPKAKYWRANNETDFFFKCPNEDACLGGKDTHSLTGDCDVGYEGNLCGVCRANYAFSGKYICAKCYSAALNVLFFIFIAVVLVAVVVVISRSAIKSAYVPKSVFSVYFKVLLNYIALFNLTSNLPLNWPNFFSQILKVSDRADTSSSSLISIDCIIPDDPFIVKTQIFTFLPILGCIIIVGVWYTISRFKEVEHLRCKIIASMCAMFFLLHSIITKHMFSLFKCLNIDGAYFMQDALDVECWATKHTSAVLAFGFPSILVWVFAVPAIIGCLIYRSRHNLSQIEVRISYGFLFNGYTSKAYLWEVVILMRKISLVAISVFFSAETVLVQSMTLMLIMIIFFSLQKHFKPYTKAQLNSLEIRSLVAIALTVYFGIFFYSRSLPSVFIYVLFAAVITANALFVLHWLLAVSRSSLLVLLTKKRRLRCLLKSTLIRKMFTGKELDAIHADDDQDIFVVNPQEPPTPYDEISKRLSTRPSVNGSRKPSKDVSISASELYTSFPESIAIVYTEDSLLSSSMSSIPERVESESSVEDSILSNDIYKTK